MAKPRSRRSTTQPTAAPPYPPSWVDRLTGLLHRLPGRPWMYYSASALLIIYISLQWVWFLRGDPLTSLVFFGLLGANIPYNLALIHYLDRRAAASLAEVRPAMSVSPSEYGRLEYELTTLPAWPTLAASLAGGAFIVLVWATYPDPLEIPVYLVGLPPSPGSARMVLILGVVLWLTTGPLLYHTLRQLGAIARIYRDHARIDLFHLRPLYAFSDLSARTAIGINVITYGYFLVTPQFLTDRSAIFAGLFLILGVVAFVWPLWGMHRLLVREKSRRQDEVSAQAKKIVTRLNQQLDRSRLGAMESLGRALANLELERAWLARIPTWPWQPETLRGVLGAILFPLVVWSLQQILSRVALR